MPKFSDLERVFDAKLAQLQSNPAGLVPEQALVLETVGGIDDFYKAIQRIHGLEWMGEFDVEDIPPDEDFYQEGKVEVGLPGMVYLVLHNQEGLSQLRSLWETFQRNPEHPQFSRGRAKFKQLFEQLKDLRPWGPEDRLRETGILEDWQERVATGQELMRIELELWPRKRSWERRRVGRWVSTLIEREGGRVLGECDSTESLAYQAMLAELPIQSVQRMLEDPTVELALCEQVMFFRPAGQILVEPPDREPEESPMPPDLGARLEREPVVALLDGLPLANHQWLAARLIVDDPDRWEDQYPANVRQHGTAMASLILHGELDAAAEPLSRPLYVRPVMKPDPQNPELEAVPRDCLTVDLIQRAVRRIVDRDGNEPPAAPRVRIINLSLGDRTRPFDRYPSPWARLLDHLAAQYNVLFVVSAGNQGRRIELPLSRSDVQCLLNDPEGLRAEVLRAVRDENRHRRLLSPAEAINVLTVGAIHADSSAPTRLPLGSIDLLAGTDLPALYSAQGLGFRRAVKPEVFTPGGRLLCREVHGAGRLSFDLIFNGAPGQKVATPGVFSGDLSAVRYTKGTSNATALVTRVACQLYDILDQLRSVDDGPGPREEDLAVLIRALLVHGCSWSDSLSLVESHLGCHSGGEEFSRICGFGRLEAARVLACTERRVTLLGWGSIQEGRAFAYDLPLPPSLSGSRVFRRLITTLAWFSPINPRHHRYRRAHVWLTRFSGGQREEDALRKLGLYRAGTESNLARRGTVQHEIYEGQRAQTYGEDETLTFQVNCRSDAGDFGQSIRYGLAITLEVAESVGLSIYDEIRTRIRPPIATPITP